MSIEKIEEIKDELDGLYEELGSAELDDDEKEIEELTDAIEELKPKLKKLSVKGKVFITGRDNYYFFDGKASTSQWDFCEVERTIKNLEWDSYTQSYIGDLKAFGSTVKVDSSNLKIWSVDSFLNKKGE